MAELRDMLNEQKPVDKTVREWLDDINSVVDENDRIKLHTFYSYLNGNRNITGTGAKALAIYFYRRGNFELVQAIAEVNLGVPYPLASAA